MIDARCIDGRDRARWHKAVEHTCRRVRRRPHRPGRAGPGREAAGRLLRHRGAAAAARRLQRARGPHAASSRPYDKGAIKAIEKAIQHSDLGINPSNDGTVIRLVVPAAHRGAPQGAVKVVKAHGRGGADRGAQPAPAARQELEALEKDGEISDRRARPGREGAREDHPRPRGARSTRRSPHKEQELLEV